MPVCINPVKGPTLDQGLNAAAIDHMPVNAPAKIKQSCIGSILLPLLHNGIYGRAAGALECSQTIANSPRGSALRYLIITHGYKTKNRGVNIGCQYLHAVCPGIQIKDLHLIGRSEEHTSELQSRGHLVCRLLLEKKIIRNGSAV